jgi:hypothetical protein
VRRETVLITSLALLAAGCGGSGDSTGGDDADGRNVVDTRDVVVVPIHQQSDSGVSGTATLSAEGDKTKVVLDLKTGSPTAGARPRPAHIHEGSCENLDPSPAYGLAGVKGGASSTTVDAKLAELLDGGYAVNVHKSATGMSRYVACGDFGRVNDISLPGYGKEFDH